MTQTLRVMMDSELSQVTGGLGMKHILLEGPHMFMVIREIVNYGVDRWRRGCKDIDDKDSFTEFFCWIYNHA